MNKKQLTLQNSSLFAELERKAKEIEILNIRLEDSEKKFVALQTEKEQLENDLGDANGKIASLNHEIEKLTAQFNEQIENLSAELEKAKSEALAKENLANKTAHSLTYNIGGLQRDENAVAVEEKPEAAVECEIDFETVVEVEPQNQNQEEAFEQSAPETAPITEAAIAETPITEAPIAEAPKTDWAPKAPLPDSTPISDLLRDHGAKLIAKVTRATAEVISKINSVDDNVASSLKTLALGKNESFKFRIMELAKNVGSYDETIKEMDFLTEETIVYLKSI